MHYKGSHQDIYDRHTEPDDVTNIFKKYFQEEQIFITVFFDKIVCYRLNNQTLSGAEEIVYQPVIIFSLDQIMANLSYFFRSLGYGWMCKDYKISIEDVLILKKTNQDTVFFQLDVLFKYGVFLKFFMRLPSDLSLPLEEFKKASSIRLDTVRYWKPDKPSFYHEPGFMQNSMRNSYKMFYPFSSIKGEDITQGQNKFPLIIDSKNSKLLKLRRITSQKDMERFEIISALDGFNQELRSSCKDFLASIKIYKVKLEEYLRPEIFFQYLVG